jgi:pimeloyl-ACP methyl ester carboxylesterase
MYSRSVFTRTVVVASYFFVFLSLFQPLAADAANGPPSSDSLPRRALLGVTAEPMPDNHVRIAKIVPGSAAARSELAIGDILIALNGSPVDSVGMFLARIKSFKSGDDITCRVQRGGKEMDIEVTLGEWPREQPGDIQVLYDAVETPEATLRSLLTKPSGTTSKLPAILYLQGFNCDSIEWPSFEPNLGRELIYRLTRAGFAVMRSEKSGVGDSTGTPCRDVGFRDEVALFVSALKKLKSYDFVDGENVFLFGHSAGGWVAPLVAAAEPVKGIVVYGTVVRPWGEYFVENRRRNLWLRSQPDLAQLEDDQRLIAQLLHYLFVEKSSVREATTKHPELTAIAKKLFPQDAEHLIDLRSLQHFRELNDQNVARVWASLDIPVLALIGEFDIRTLPMDHEYIAAIVNARHPGKGTWQVLPKMDHGFALHQSLKDSVTHEFKGPFGEQVVQETVKWMQEIVTRRHAQVLEPEGISLND